MHVLNAMPPYNMFGLEEQDYESAKIAVLPVPYDSTASFKSGSREGPRAIVEASRNIELYSEEFGEDISKLGIYTLEELAPDFGSPEGMVNRISKEIDILLEDSKFPIMLGGEHTISIGAVKILSNKFGKDSFSVVHFDAHSDSRNEFMGAKVCHACVMARIRELCSSAISIGVRSIDKESMENYGKDIIFMSDIRAQGVKKVLERVIKSSREKVYISVDLDVLDPSEMPSTGTPEPDGLRFRELADMIKEIAKSKEIIGMDFVELMPIAGLEAPNYLAAKLIYLSIGSAFFGKRVKPKRTSAMK
ncbi:MAG: agmatinase [Candidatus Micrarchaeia archaeon]